MLSQGVWPCCCPLAAVIPDYSLSDKWKNLPLLTYSCNCTSLLCAFRFELRKEPQQAHVCPSAFLMIKYCYYYPYSGSPRMEVTGRTSPLFFREALGMPSGSHRGKLIHSPTEISDMLLWRQSQELALSLSTFSLSWVTSAVLSVSVLLLKMPSQHLK